MENVVKWSHVKFRKGDTIMIRNVVMKHRIVTANKAAILSVHVCAEKKREFIG